MKLKISYFPSDDILLMDNGCPRAWGTDVAKNVIVYTDNEHKPAAIEISGATKLLCPVLYAKRVKSAPRDCTVSSDRPDEDDIDRFTLPLTVSYDGETDTLTLESGLPTPFEQVIADGLIAFYDGEDQYGKFINAVRLENAASVLKPYLAP